MSLGLGNVAQVNQHIVAPEVGGDGNSTRRIAMGNTTTKWEVETPTPAEDFKIKDAEAGVDRLIISKASGDLDTNGGNMTVNTLNYTALNPPVGGGGGVNNPMTSDLDAANFLISNSAYGKTLFTDQAPSTAADAVYDETIITGAYNRQPVVGTQEDFNNAATQFPTSLRCQMANNIYTTAKNGVFSRRTALPLAVGASGNYLSLGNQLSFKDRVTYDPLNMRYDPTVANSWTAVKFSDNLGAMCPSPAGTLCKMIITLHTHLEGAWAAQTNNNQLKVFARQYRGGGVLRDYQISRINGYSGREVVRSDSRYLLAFSSGLGEDFQNDDYLEIWLENDAGGTDDFFVTLFKCFIEVSPCP